MFGILAFGASITFGRGDNAHGGWTGRLKEYFEAQDYYHCFYNLGIPRESTVGLLKRFETECRARIQIKRPGDKFVILIAMGTNDSRLNNTSDNPQTEPKLFKKNILKLIKLSQKYTQHIVFIGLTPVDEKRTQPYEETYFFNERIEKYNDIIRDSCQKNKILFLNMFEKWKNLDPVKLLGDGLHPNAQGYEKMYQIIKDFLIKNKIIK
ncbi:MAG: hypothetical protein KAT77_00660 [Nanoarchaeota archaeon]|nr:hypothetical protein [Nanoarchaeota archaeon]